MFNLDHPLVRRSRAALAIAALIAAVIASMTPLGPVQAREPAATHRAR